MGSSQASPARLHPPRMPSLPPRGAQKALGELWRPLWDPYKDNVRLRNQEVTGPGSHTVMSVG